MSGGGQRCPVCELSLVEARVVLQTPRWRVVHDSDPVVVVGKLFVTLQRHAESLADLSDAEAAELGPLLRVVVGALSDELRPRRVHVGSYGESVPHVHFHVTPRHPWLPRGNVPTSVAVDMLSLLVRVRLRRPAVSSEVDALVARLRAGLQGVGLRGFEPPTS